MRRFTPTVITVAAFAAAGFCGQPAPAVALPEGRHYEMVSPPYKAGYGVFGSGGVAPGGNGAIFFSEGVFAKAPRTFVLDPYQAVRGTSEWQTFSPEPPMSQELEPGLITLAPETLMVDTDPAMSSTLWAERLGTSYGSSFNEVREVAFVLDTPGEGSRLVGEVLREPHRGNFEVFYQGASPDFCRILFRSDVPLLRGAPQEDLYEMPTGCGGETGLRLVALNNNGVPIDPKCGSELGPSSSSGSQTAFNAIADDGREIVFPSLVTASVCGSQGRHQLFVRLDGTRTIELSRPVSQGVCAEVPCPGASERPEAIFAGASEDGSKVFFTIPAPLVEGDGDTSNTLYLAKIGCPREEACEVSQKQVTSLVRVSRARAGEAAEVKGIVRSSSDGSHIYFVATGLLTEESGPEGSRAQVGADNLYVYETGTGKVSFIADLCSGAGTSGSVRDAWCPSALRGEQQNDVGLWTSAGHTEEAEAQVNTCERAVEECIAEREPGRFLVFSTYAQLIHHGVSADTDSAKDVYRYDAQSKALDRVSIGEAGFGANGNCNDAQVAACAASISHSVADMGSESIYAQRQMPTRAMSEDGSRIVFGSIGALSPSAVNGLADVYEWHKEASLGEGAVSLVSTGTSPTPDRQPVITPSGGGIFFTTTQGLSARDTDGLEDVYDARAGGGFPAEAVGHEACGGEACYGPLMNPAPVLIPGSVVQAPVASSISKPNEERKVKRNRRIKTRHGMKRRRHRRRGHAGARKNRAFKGVHGRSGR